MQSRPLAGRKIALLLDQEYQELEVWYPYYRFREAGADVFRIAPKAGEVYKSKLGYTCPSDAAAGARTCARSQGC